MRTSRGCICGRRFMQEANEGTCLKCGHGDPVTHPRVEFGADDRARLPRDLGALARLAAGRRLPSGRFLNCL